MTTVARLRLIANAGDPDDILPLRIDVVEAACAYIEKGGQSDATAMLTHGNLIRAVRRYRAALRKRHQIAKGERRC